MICLICLYKHSHWYPLLVYFIQSLVNIIHFFYNEPNTNLCLYYITMHIVHFTCL